jgi:ABC-type nickel/cobalt efflux system permease component RcnA
MKAASDLLYRSACVRLRSFGALAAAVLLSLLAASALTDALAQVSPLAAMRQPPATGIVGWVLAEQAMFYRALSGLIRAAKSDGSAYWSLIGISFIYGIFHAAGPGHGKAVISSYLVANEETWRRGVALSFASALLQAVTAIVIVSVAAGLLGATAKMMGDTVRVIEIASYSLIVLLGARLLWVKGRGFFRALRAVHQERPGHADHHHHEHSHDHAHDHDHDDEGGVLPWGHVHGPEPEDLAGPGGWRRGFSAIVAVGLRPCSGAIIVLVFALAQGLYWAGVASTFVMALGTAITVAAIATIAVGARTAAKRVASTGTGYGTLILRGIEVGAAVVVMTFGVLLLTGYMASERMGMF